MGQAIGDVLPLAIGAAISPVPIIVLAVLGGKPIGDGIGSLTS